MVRLIVGLCSLSLLAGLTGAEPELPTQLTFSVKYYSDAFPLQRHGFLDVRMTESGASLRWMYARTGGLCVSQMQARLVTAEIEREQLERRLRAAGICRFEQRQIQRKLGGDRPVDFMDHPTFVGISVTCSGDQRTLYLPDAGHRAKKVYRQGTRLGNLRSLMWDLTIDAFGPGNPFAVDDDTDFAHQRAAEPLVTELIAGRYSVSRGACSKPPCEPQAWTPTFKDYRGAIHNGEAASNAVTASIEVPEAAEFDAYVAPKYPRLCRQARIQGDIKLRVRVDEDDGRIAEVLATDGHPLLLQAVADVYPRWRFDQTVRAERLAQVIVRFSLMCDGSL